MKPVGGLISKDRKAYDYLPDSIEEFPDPERFLDIMRHAGFKECRRKSLSLGIAQIYIGQKP
jgi:demethylmenaquinone methyltransferase/2-methoxy-6-polyprenyl-1,4-benzoquinol methylase